MDSLLLIRKIDTQQNFINPACTGLDMQNCQIFWIIVWYLYWLKFLQVIFCSCSITWPVQLIREVFHLDISFICWFRVIRVLFLAEKVDGVRNMGLGEPWCFMYRYSSRPSWTCPWDLSVSVIRLFSCTKQDFQSWGLLFFSTRLSGFKNYKTG